MTDDHDLTGALVAEMNMPSIAGPRPVVRTALTDALAAEGVPCTEQDAPFRVPPATVRQMSRLREGDGEDHAMDEFLEILQSAHDALAAVLLAYRRRMATRAASD